MNRLLCLFLFLFSILSSFLVAAEDEISGAITISFDVNGRVETNENTFTCTARANFICVDSSSDSPNRRRVERVFSITGSTRPCGSLNSDEVAKDSLRRNVLVGGCDNASSQDTISAASLGATDAQIFADNQYQVAARQAEVQNTDEIEVVRECIDKTERARERCNADRDDGLQNALGAVDTGVAGLSAMTGGSMQASCSKMGKLMLGLNGALLAYKAICLAEYTSCSTTCGTASDLVRDLERLSSRLQQPDVGAPESVEGFQSVMRKLGTEVSTQITDYVNRIAGAGGQIASTPAQKSNLYAQQFIRVRDLIKSRVEVAQEDCQDNNRVLSRAGANVLAMYSIVQNSRNCQQAGATNPADEAFRQFCQQNPGYPMCSQLAGGNQDCSNASNTSQFCVCMRNPRDPQCLSAEAAGSNLSQKMAGTGSSGGAGAGGSASLSDADLLSMSGAEFGGDGYGNVGDPSVMSSGQTQKQVMGAGGGPRAGLSGGTGQAKGGGGGGGRSALDPNILRGSYGGGNSGSGGGSYSSSGGMNYGSNSSNLNNSQYKAYMPNAQNPNRNPANAVGPDGITGPETPIWSKVKGRYLDLLNSFIDK